MGPAFTASVVHGTKATTEVSESDEEEEAEEEEGEVQVGCDCEGEDRTFMNQIIRDVTQKHLIASHLIHCH